MVEGQNDYFIWKWFLLVRSLLLFTPKSNQILMIFILTDLQLSILIQRRYYNLFMMTHSRICGISLSEMREELSCIHRWNRAKILLHYNYVMNVPVFNLCPIRGLWEMQPASYWRCNGRFYCGKAELPSVRLHWRLLSGHLCCHNIY